MTMTTIVYPCGRCGLRHEVDVSLAGKQLACSQCAAPMTIPIPRSRAPISNDLASRPSNQTTGMTLPTSANGEISYKHECEECGKRHQVPEALFGKKVPCRRCGEMMQLRFPQGYVPRSRPPKQARAFVEHSSPSSSNAPTLNLATNSAAKPTWASGLEAPPVIPKPGGPSGPPLRVRRRVSASDAVGRAQGFRTPTSACDKAADRADKAADRGGEPSDRLDRLIDRLG